MKPLLLLLPVVAALAGILAYLYQRSLARRAREGRSARRAQAEAQAQEQRDRARERANQALAAAEEEAEALRQRRRQQSAAEAAARRADLKKAEERHERRQQTLAKDEERRAARAEQLKEREAELAILAEQKRQASAEALRLRAECERTLLQVAGESREDAAARLRAEWVDEAREEAREVLRQIEAQQGSADPESTRQARRILDIASQRYHGHYLTERLVSNVHLPPGAGERVFGSEEVLALLSEVSRVKLTLSEDKLILRIEGQDSFGREIARRAIARLLKGAPRGGLEGLRRSVEGIAEELDRETVELGKRAFRDLAIPRAHPEIVKLVGRLNFRTSYTQNQWKHAVESAVLCGMMAQELRLDVKLARRAALMHDIGKALTHEIDGSHAVIGADYARRLGEEELVANAIGAHHTDEPFNSPYALLVAAADAMSGGRPGARHEQADNYVQRIESLERIAGGFGGVERVYAAAAGREVRVHVKEGRVNDVQAAELSSEIAARISEGMVFPGQIKVTVIREVMATAIAS